MKTVKNRSNHPPLSYFDQSFSDNPADILFCSLNEIESAFLEPDGLMGNEFHQPQIIDPRTKLPIAQSLYDYTLIPDPEIFKCSNRSLLTKKEHITCVAFLQSVKAKKQIFPHQIQCFQDTAVRRQTEMNTFSQFLLQYNNANYEKIYAPSVMCMELHQEHYKREVEKLMAEYRDGIFQIHTGFPIPRICGNVETLGAISDVELVASGGVPRLLDPKLDLSKMRTRVGTYLEYCAIGGPKCEKIWVTEQQVQFVISTEALVFLLSAGEYIDIPTEVVVTVSDVDGERVICINDPLPSRNVGVHTCEAVVGKCAEAFLALMDNREVKEIHSTEENKPYAPQTFDNFMMKNKSIYKMQPLEAQFNQVKWTISLENSDKQISILTQTKQHYTVGRNQAHYSLKLEFKPQFGCEIPSKSRLLREWISLRLSTSPHASVRRHRINAKTFATILDESLSIDDIEQELDRLYKIKTARLLGSLSDFLTLLSKASIGRFLLRYNTRFKDKLMLYSETKEVTSKTCVSLYGLLQERPSDMPFMTLRQLTPIDDTLCSAIHDFYHVLPCAFPPGRAKQTHKIIDDRNFILKKVQEKSKLVAEKASRALERRKKVKRLKKKQKLKRLSKQIQEEKKDVQELENDINRDRILYGFNVESS